MLKSGVTPDQIGVVTPYDGQRAFIITNMVRTVCTVLELCAIWSVCMYVPTALYLTHAHHMAVVFGVVHGMFPPFHGILSYCYRCVVVP